jgi:AcrR family transcriptional regulator
MTSSPEPATAEPVVPTGVDDYPHGRVPRAVREQQVLAVAERLFAERGYRGASMDELATRVGVSKPVIYDLVGSKESLYLRCVERAGRALSEVVAGAALTETEPEARIRVGAIAFLRFVAEEQGGWDLLLTAGPEPGAEPILAVRAQQSALLTELTRETVERLGVELEEWRISALAHALNGTFEGLAYWWRANSEVGEEELVDWISQLFFPGIRALAGLPAPDA